MASLERNIDFEEILFLFMQRVFLQRVSAGRNF
jgi:hypothetical protein